MFWKVKLSASLKFLLNPIKTDFMIITSRNNRAFLELRNYKYTSLSQLLGPFRQAEYNSSTLTERPEKLRLIHSCNVFGSFINQWQYHLHFLHKLLVVPGMNWYKYIKFSLYTGHFTCMSTFLEFVNMFTASSMSLNWYWSQSGIEYRKNLF